MEEQNIHLYKIGNGTEQARRIYFLGVIREI